MTAHKMTAHKKRFDSRRGSARDSVRSLAGFVLLALLSGACSQVSTPSVVFQKPEPPADRPIARIPPEFTSSDSCRGCHAREYESWHASFHRTMTQEVGPGTVLPEWEGEVTSDERLFRFERRGDEFWVELDDPEVESDNPEWSGHPPRVWRRIALSTGSHNFQAYWFPSGATRKLYLFPLCFRIDEQRWMPIDAAFIEPSRHRRSTLPFWNLGCLKCHTTQPAPRISSEDVMDTTVAEFGIACEACHGPANEHASLNQNPLRRFALHTGDVSDDTIVNPVDLKADRSSEVCGQCHGLTTEAEGKLERFNRRGTPYQPGRRLLAQRDLITEGEEYYWSDGQVRVSGREYNGLIRSPCFTHEDEERRLSCFSCHQMHLESGDPRSLEEWRVYQLKDFALENRACTQCHEQYAGAEALQAHTHHDPDGAASSCYECHMPFTTWGLLKGIRSHTVTSPSVEESVDVKRPNACNLCHLDRTLAWTASKLEDWYGMPSPELDADQRQIATGALWALIGDGGLRALTAWHMGRKETHEAAGSNWMAPYLATMLDDYYPAVRFRVGRSLRALPGFEDFEYDFQGASEAQADARRRASEEWARIEHGSDRNAPELLIRGGQLEGSDFERLLGLRDHTLMRLSE